MTHDERTPGVVAGRLSAERYQANFADLHPALSDHEAWVEADRCYYCYDAPCTEACPTSIDIPLFIRQISGKRPMTAAATILEQNIMGGMCARVCPTEELCEEVCVRNTAEEKPVRIGLLQRYATDKLFDDGRQIFFRVPASGKRVAVVGAGPAGLACAHRLSRLGHEVRIFEAREKAGGLNEYGIAYYKTLDDFAQREVDYILALGGISIDFGKALGKDISLAELRRDYDAVFLGMGLGAVRDLGLAGEAAEGFLSAIDYIARLRQADALSDLPVGRRALVIGGGMTAIDIAVQSRLLGAEEVTIAYRRGPEAMKASEFERDLAQTKGVKIRYNAVPQEVLTQDGRVSGVVFAYSDVGENASGETFRLEADLFFKAIGQTLVPHGLTENGEGENGTVLALDSGKIAIDDQRRSSLTGVWAGGDCAGGGQDLTVAAVEDGKIAALSIDRELGRKGDA